MAAELQKPGGGGYPGATREVDTVHVVGGFVVTVLLHGVLIGLVILGTMQGGQNIEDEIQPKMLEFEQVDLLALGEEKPPNQLPRITNPAPPEKKQDEIVLNKPDEPVVELEKKEPEKAEEKEDPEERKKKMLDALSALHNPNRPTNEDVPEGAEEGVVGGSVSDAALANLTKTYAAKLNEEVTRFWDVPKTVSPGEIKSLGSQVSVYIRLSEQGHITTYRFRSKSENQPFNDSIDRVLKRFQVSYGGRTLPLPDTPEVKQAVLTQGINLNSWEYTGQ